MAVSLIPKYQTFYNLYLCSYTSMWTLGTVPLVSVRIKKV